MVSKTMLDPTTNPIELLDNTLEHTWETLCTLYDVETDLPILQNLFANAAIKTPPKAAENVLVNMILEIMENVGRFSSWYKQPARVFGLVSLRDPISGRSLWMLAPEALNRWQGLLKDLTQVIKLNNGLIQATLLVENLSLEDLEGSQVIAQCSCCPPKRIQISLSALDKTTIICEDCHSAFQ